MSNLDRGLDRAVLKSVGDRILIPAWIQEQLQVLAIGVALGVVEEADAAKIEHFMTKQLQDWPVAKAES